jgi:hypothetical protein
MSASRRAAKTRYVFTGDRDRIGMVAGLLCGCAVLAVSVFVQQLPLLATLFRTLVAILVTYVAVYAAVWLGEYLRETQSIPAKESAESEGEETESK